MSLTEFTFLNATSTAKLSQVESKRMRTHITKTNFAKRRQRLAGTVGLEPGPVKSRHKNRVPLLWCMPSVESQEKELSATTRYTDSRHFARCVVRYWSLLGQDWADINSADEASWIDFLVSDPVLIESIRAVGAQNWTREDCVQPMAEVHISRALGFMAQHINTGQAYTDAMLGAVSVMAFGESLMHNNFAWNIHVRGLAQVIKERHSRGVCDLPLWFLDLLIFDSMNDIFNFPRFYHKDVVDATRLYGYQTVSDVGALCDSLIHFQTSIDANNMFRLESDLPIGSPEECLNGLICHAQTLQLKDDPAIQVTSLAIELFLYLSWLPQKKDHLMPIAEGLKEAYYRVQVSPCAHIELTSCQLMIGAIAADEGSQTRAWFITKLKNAKEALEARGWSNPLDVLAKGIKANPNIMQRMRALWRELDH